MKKAFAFFLILMCGLGVYAQKSNVIVFCQDGHPFYVVIDGVRINDYPATNVKIEQVTATGHKLRVIFSEEALGVVDKNLYLEPNVEYSLDVKEAKKGGYKLSLVGMVDISEAPEPAPNQTVIVYGQPQEAPREAVTTVEETTVTTTTTTSGSDPAPSGSTEEFSMGVNVDGVSMDVNVSVSDNGMSTNTSVGESSVSSSTTTTTTTTTTVTGGGTVAEDAVYVEEAAPCNMMGGSDFASAKSSIEGKSFSDSKMTLAKQITRGNCLTAVQVMEITELFDFESDRLEYAKFAYDYVYDRNNYYKVNDAFDFESTIEELEEYISGR